MGRGSYLGGSTVIGPRSGWFSKSRSRKKKRRKGKLKHTAAAISGRNLILSEREARKRGLTRQEWLQRMRSRSDDIRAEIARQQDVVLAADERLKRELARLAQLLQLQKMVQQSEGKGHVDRNGCAK